MNSRPERLADLLPSVVADLAARHHQPQENDMNETTYDDADYDETYEERDPTPVEKLTDLMLRIQSAQDAVGWAPQNGSEFEEATARTVVEYGRALRDLIGVVRTLLPADGTAGVQR